MVAAHETILIHPEQQERCPARQSSSELRRRTQFIPRFHREASRNGAQLSKRTQNDMSSPRSSLPKSGSISVPTTRYTQRAASTFAQAAFPYHLRRTWLEGAGHPSASSICATASA